MGRYTQWITYRDKQILRVDCQDLNEPEFLQAMDEMYAELLKSPPNGVGVLTLMNPSKTRMTNAMTAKAREVTAALTAQGIQQKPSALVGLNGLLRSIAGLINRRAGTKDNMYYADTEADAKEWLVQQDK